MAAIDHEQRLAEQVTVDLAVLRQLYEDSQTAVKARDTLLAAISHDLQSPLAAVRFSADALLLEAAGPADPVAAAANIILLAERQMAGLITDLVDVAQLQAGRMILRSKQQGLEPMIREIFQLLEARAGPRQIQLSIHGAADPVWCDRERILRLFDNLLGNAIKFAPHGSRVEVHLDGQPDQVVVSVSSQGWDLSQALLPHLFEAWANGGSQAGSGLGLFIAKGIVEAHGGEIWLSGTGQGPGSITFSLPNPRVSG